MITKAWIVGMMFLALVGCQAMTGKTTGQNVDDAGLTASVKSTLVADKVHAPNEHRQLWLQLPVHCVGFNHTEGNHGT